MSKDPKDPVTAISQIAAVPTILEVVCRTTGMGFAAVARVTEDQWIACAVRDEIDFGLKPGGENGTWFQRYPITQSKLDVAASHVGFMIGGKHVHAEFAQDARRVAGGLPKGESGGPAPISIFFPSAGVSVRPPTQMNPAMSRSSMTASRLVFRPPY